MTKAPLSGRDSACVSGKRNRARGWVLQPVPRPPIAPRRDAETVKQVEGVGRRVQQALDVDLEVIAILAVAPEDAPLERRRLPIAAAEQGARLVGDDVPARNGEGEVEL